MWSTFNLRIPIVLLLAVAMTACDSNENEDKTPTEIETLVGTWAITGFMDNSGDRSDIIADGYAGVHLEFGENGTGAFEIFPKSGPDRLLPFTYVVDDEVDLITIVTNLPIDLMLSLELTYIFDVQAQKALFHTPQTDMLNWIFDCDLVGDVRVVASKFGEDGAVE